MKCENPFCENIAEGWEHEIFPGRGRRQRCKELGYVVRPCYSCHYRSHHEHGKREWWQRLWCRAIGVDYDEAVLAVNMSKLERTQHANTEVSSI